MSNYIKPAGSPPCWGRQYQDGERECEQCKFNETCRPAMLANVVQPRVSLPMQPPPPPVQRMLPAPVNPMSAMVPMPPKPAYPLAQTQVFTKPATTPTPPPAPVPVPAVTTPQYFQSSSGYSLPNPRQPNPLQPMHRPGATAPAYYFTQYPGESVASRIGKNIILRALEAIFGELLMFFRHWTWPPAY